jgi:Pao retrotransposon peptidase
LFKVNYKTEKLTKRHIVSTVARIFDPIGWLQPTILLGKRFMQKLSADNFDWDAVVPEIFNKSGSNTHQTCTYSAINASQDGQATYVKLRKYLTFVTRQKQHTPR